MSSNLRDQVLLYAGRIAKWAQFSSNNGFGRGFMQGPEEDQSLGEKPQPQPVRLLQNFGFRSMLRQGAGEGVVIAARGGPANAIAVAVDDQQVGPTDLKEGEVCVYNALDSGDVLCRILLDTAGNVTVIPKAGAKVRLGDGEPANLDPVVLVTQLRTEFNAFVNTYNGHSHAAGALTAGATPVTGTTAIPGSQAVGLTAAVGSSNVLGKT